MPDITTLQVAFYICLNMPKNPCRGRTNEVFSARVCQVNKIRWYECCSF